MFSSGLCWVAGRRQRHGFWEDKPESEGSPLGASRSLGQIMSRNLAAPKPLSKPLAPSFASEAPVAPSQALKAFGGWITPAKLCGATKYGRRLGEGGSVTLEDSGDSRRGRRT